MRCSEIYQPLLNRELGRRKFLKGSTAAALGAATLAACGDGQQGNRAPSREAVIPSSPLQREIEALQANGINASEAEKNLWSKEPFVPLENRNLPVESLDALVRTKASNIVNKMASSKNPYFSEAGNLITAMLSEGRLSLETEGADPRRLLMGARPTEVNLKSRKVSYTFTFYAKSALADFDEQSTASALVHEARHLKDYRNFLDPYESSQADITNLEQVFRHRFANPQGCTDTESGAYADEARSYIHQKALVPTFFNPILEAKAQDFYGLGANETSPPWRDLVFKYSACATR